jgi:hypothetical protein
VRGDLAVNSPRLGQTAGLACKVNEFSLYGGGVGRPNDTTGTGPRR